MDIFHLLNDSLKRLLNVEANDQWGNDIKEVHKREKSCMLKLVISGGEYLSHKQVFIDQNVQTNKVLIN